MDTKREKNYDLLTGLLLRRSFWNEADAMARPGVEFCMLSFDVENFGLYNRWYGRDAGDESIKLLGAMLKKAQDEFPGLIAGYFGGDDFSVVLPYDLDVVYEIVRRYQELVATGDTTIFSLHIGAFHGISDHIKAADAMDRARAAMNMGEADDHGICWYTEEIDHQVQEQGDFIPDILNALDAGEFTIYLQPKWEIETGRVVSAEALVRRILPDGTVVSPGNFVPQLERLGFISLLDRYVWELTFKTMRDWMDRGIPSYPVSMNVSRNDIATLDVPAEIVRLSNKYDIPPTLVEIEITESAYAEDENRVKAAEAAFREAGFHVMIDDFGSGYSSLNFLREVDADVLKLDMRFLDFDPKGAETKGIDIIQNVLNMAHQLDMFVIVEGLETEAQREALMLMGCKYAQGYLFYKPMPIDEYEKILSTPDLMSSQTWVQRRSSKSFLMEIADHFWRIAETNIVTGEYRFLRNVPEPDYVKTPRPETLEEHYQRYVDHGVIHPADAPQALKMLSKQNLQNFMAGDAQREICMMRIKEGDRYNWFEIHVSRPESFSASDPWILVTWERSADDMSMIQDCFQVATRSYRHICRIDLNTGACTEAGFRGHGSKKAFEERSVPMTVDQLAKASLDMGYIHPDDAEEFRRTLNCDYLRSCLKSDENPRVSAAYREKDRTGKMNWCLVEIVRGVDFTDQDPIAVMTVRELIHEVGNVVLQDPIHK